jgi:hypothetical protein
MTPVEKIVLQFTLRIFLRSIQLLGIVLAIWFAAFLLRLIGFALGF